MKTITKHKQAKPKMVPPWRKTDIMSRAVDCVLFLSLWGFLTASERDRVRRRIETARKHREATPCA